MVYAIQTSCAYQSIGDDMEENAIILQLFLFIELGLCIEIEPHVSHVFYVWIMSELNAIHFLYKDRKYFNLMIFCQIIDHPINLLLAKIKTTKRPPIGTIEYQRKIRRLSSSSSLSNNYCNLISVIFAVYPST